MHSIRRNPLATYETLAAETDLRFSHRAFARILHEQGVEVWRFKKRPYLTAACAALRLHLNKDWSNTVFTDECSGC